MANLTDFIYLDVSPQQRRWFAPQAVFISEGFPCGRFLLGERHANVYEHVQQPLLAQPQNQLRHQLLHALQRRHSSDLHGCCRCARTRTRPEPCTRPRPARYSPGLRPSIPPCPAHNNNIVRQRQPYAAPTQDSGGDDKLCPIPSCHGAQQRLRGPQTCGDIHARAPHALLCCQPSDSGANGGGAGHGARPEQSRLARLKPELEDRSIWKQDLYGLMLEVWQKKRLNLGWSSPATLYSSVFLCVSTFLIVREERNWSLTVQSSGNANSSVDRMNRLGNEATWNPLILQIFFGGGIEFPTTWIISQNLE